MSDTVAFGVSWFALTGGCTLVWFAAAGVIETRRVESDRTTRRVLTGILAALIGVGGYIAALGVQVWLA